MLELLRTPAQASKQRTQTIKHWYVSQAIDDANPVALLNITLTDTGQIITKGIGLEPEHAQTFIDAMTTASQRIQEQIKPGNTATVHLLRTA